MGTRAEPAPESWAECFLAALRGMGLRGTSLGTLREGCRRIALNQGQILLIEDLAVPGESGRTFFDGEAWHIWCDPTEGYRRRRFTLAHEVGHFLLRQRGAAVAMEERWCDRFAASVLAPAAEVAQVMAGPPADDVIDIVERVMDVFGLGFQAALRRVNEVGGTALAVVLFQSRHGRWVLSSTSGLPRGVAVSLLPADATDATLGSMPQGARGPATLPLVVCGQDVALPVTAVRRFDYCHVVLRLTDLPRPSAPAGAARGGRTRHVGGLV